MRLSLILLPALLLAACSDSTRYYRPGTDMAEAARTERACKREAQASMAGSTRERVDALRDNYDPAGGGNGMNSDSYRIRSSMNNASRDRAIAGAVDSCMRGMGYSSR
ncbi:hypothetical protein ACFSM5_06680 [Lacibacterium aquatile]|uniref:Lipoprotein n=1 Tax=Lacibacterium aquatile TaxID=1168082 RepID=A0ABW5DN78_9PROT